MGRRVSTLLVGLMLIAACGGGSGSDDDPGATPTTATAESGDTSPTTVADSADDGDTADDSGQAQELPFESGEGYYEVDGERIQAEWVVNCATDDQILEVIAWGGDGNALELEVSEYDLAGQPNVSYQPILFSADLGVDGLVAFEADRLMTGPDGAWYVGAERHLLLTGEDTGEMLDEPPFEMEGDSVSGTFPVEGPDGSRTVSYELTVPGETFDCDEF